MLMMAESLLEDCLQENKDMLRRATPLMEKTQPKLCRAKGYLNTILSQGRLTVSPLSSDCPGLVLKLSFQPLCGFSFFSPGT